MKINLSRSQAELIIDLLTLRDDNQSKELSEYIRNMFGMTSETGRNDQLLYDVQEIDPGTLTHDAE